MTTPTETVQPLKRHWGLGVTATVLGLVLLGLGVGDFFQKKASAGAVVLGLGAVLLAAGIACFRWRFTPPPPEPRLARWRYGAALGAGVLASLAFPICFPVFSHHEQFASGVLEIFAFVGLVPLYLALDGLSPKRAMWLGFLAGMAFFNMTFWWVNVAMTTFGGIPNVLSIPVLQLLVAWCALHWGLACLGAALLRRRFGWPLWLALPITWCASELMRNYFMSGYPWTNFGYATTRDLYFAQVAALGGVYLIAFLLLLVNGAVYETAMALVRKDRPLPRRALGAAVFVLLAGHGYGAMRVRTVDAALAHAKTVKVALIQGNIDQKIKSRHESFGSFILNQYVPQTNAADDEGAELIIWPEAAYPGYFPPGAISVARPPFRSHYRANLVLGVGTANRQTHRSTNSAFWVRPDLTVAGQYDKHHLVPFGEYVLWNLDRYLPIGPLVQDVGFFEPGTSLPIWDIKVDEPLAGLDVGAAARDVKVGMLICYDAIFPEITRDYAQRDADLLVNITNDAWYGIASAPFQFLRMVEMRAIESGRSVARAANTGISAFIDPAGRITAQTELGIISSDSDEVDEALHVPAVRLVRDVPLVEIHTVYSRIGDVFAYLCALLTIGGAGLAILQKKRAVNA